MGNRKVQIRVQPRHIAAGLQASPGCCPISLAIREKLDVVAVNVAIRRFFYTKKGGDLSEEIELPIDATWFVAQFDTGLPVKPFEFEVEVPAEVVRG